jgi:hypothetical protein
MVNTTTPCQTGNHSISPTRRARAEALWHYLIERGPISLDAERYRMLARSGFSRAETHQALNFLERQGRVRLSGHTGMLCVEAIPDSMGEGGIA